MIADVWAVVLRGFPGEDDEVAAVFASHADAQAYAGWWNREELRRFGSDSTATAVVEETDYHPAGSWLLSSRLSVVPTNQTGERNERAHCEFSGTENRNEPAHWCWDGWPTDGQGRYVIRPRPG